MIFFSKGAHEDGTLRDFIDKLNQTPGDDQIRLSFADWLEKNDYADRAEFIRVDLALSNYSCDRSKRAGLEAKKKALFEAGKQTWFANSPLLSRMGAVSAQRYHRGFLNQISFRAEDVPTKGPISAILPATELRIYCFDSVVQLDEILRHESLEGVARLYLEGGERLSSRQALAAIALSPRLSRLRELSLYDFALRGAERVHALFGEHSLRFALSKLKLDDCKLDDSSLQSLGTLTGWERLECLELSSADCRSIDILLRSQDWGHLKSLALTDISCGDEGLESVLKHRLFSQLRVLKLVHCSISGASIVRLAKAKGNHLQHLALGYNAIDDEGLMALSKGVEQGSFPELVSLDLAHNPLSFTRIAAFIETLHLPQLSHLSLGDSQLSEEQWRHLGQLGHAKGLTLSR